MTRAQTLQQNDIFESLVLLYNHGVQKAIVHLRLHVSDLFALSGAALDPVAL